MGRRLPTYGRLVEASGQIRGACFPHRVGRARTSRLYSSRESKCTRAAARLSLAERTLYGNFGTPFGLGASTLGVPGPPTRTLRRGALAFFEASRLTRCPFCNAGMFGK